MVKAYCKVENQEFSNTFASQTDAQEWVNNCKATADRWKFNYQGGGVQILEGHIDPDPKAPRLPEAKKDNSMYFYAIVAGVVIFLWFDRKKK